jgi:SAM-dependent methyltransferase
MERAVYDRIRTLELAHWWFVGRRRVLSRLIGQLALPKRAKILEVGCGAGGNIPMLSDFGGVDALEPDQPSRDYVREHCGVEPKDGHLPDDLPYAPKSFDAVCAFDVVEHVADGKGAMQALGKLVAPGGYLVVTVPAYQWMWSHHDELHHHKRRYTRDRILEEMRAAGLLPVKASYFNALLFPLAAVVRLAKRALHDDRADDRMPSPMVNSLLRKLFSLEAGWLSRRSLPFGLSIVVIGQAA